ncbi:MAG: hypothetical protein AAF686_09795 [Pseudomonadota bacterium]
MRELKTLLVGLGAMAFAASPLLSDGFGGFDPDQFRVPQIDPPVVPAGYAFSIWGLLYLWLVAGAAYGLLRRKTDADWDEMRLPLAISLGVGAIWIPVAQVSPFWATILIWVMWAGAARAMVTAGEADRFWQRSPIALYAGWLTAAGLVSLTLLLAGNGWIGSTTAALAAIVSAFFLALWVQRLRPDTPEYTLTVIWALIGIVIGNLEPLNLIVAALAGGGATILGAMTLRLFLKPVPAPID